jgi:hypothetical protein
MRQVFKNNESNLNIYLALAIVFIILARFMILAFLYLKQISPSPVQDPLEYRNLAINILKGNPFSMAQNPPYVFDLIRTPAYPFFLSLTFWFDETGYLAVFLQQIMIIVSAWMLWAVLRRYQSYKTVPLIFAAFLLVDPRIWFWSLETMTEALFMFLTMSAVFFMLFPEVIRMKHIAGSAFSFGLALLTRPSGLLWLAGFMIFFAFYKTSFRRKFFAFFSFIIIIAIIISPWVWRNYKLVGKPILSASQPINYALGFQREQNMVTSACSDFIKDSKGRKACLFRSFTLDGFNDVERLVRDLRKTTSLYSFLKRNIIGGYYFWTPNDYKDIVSIVRNSISGAKGDLSGKWLFFADASYIVYSLFLILTGILALTGFVFLYKNGKRSVLGLLGGIVFFSTFLNFGMAGGRHHLILLPIVLFLAGLGSFYTIEHFQYRLLIIKHSMFKLNKQ